MTTVYQIGFESTLFKDLVFGWVFTGADMQIILSSANEAEVQHMLSAIPSTPLFTDARGEMLKRLQEVREANALEDECRSLVQEQQTDVENKRVAALAVEQATRDKRQAEIRKLEDSMRVWFSGGLLRYDLKDSAGHTYGAVEVYDHGYDIIDARGRVFSEKKTLGETAQTIADKWW